MATRKPNGTKSSAAITESVVRTAATVADDVSQHITSEPSLSWFIEACRPDFAGVGGDDNDPEEERRYSEMRKFEARLMKIVEPAIKKAITQILTDAAMQVEQGGRR